MKIYKKKLMTKELLNWKQKKQFLINNTLKPIKKEKKRVSELLIPETSSPLDNLIYLPMRID